MGKANIRDILHVKLTRGITTDIIYSRDMVAQNGMVCIYHKKYLLFLFIIQSSIKCLLISFMCFMLLDIIIIL